MKKVTRYWTENKDQYTNCLCYSEKKGLYLDNIPEGDNPAELLYRPHGYTGKVNNKIEIPGQNIEINICSEYLENKYEEVYKDIKDIKYITGIKHLFYYLVVKQLKDLSHFNSVEIVKLDDYLEMDIHSIRNLELIETYFGLKFKNIIYFKNFIGCSVELIN